MLTFNRPQMIRKRKIQIFTAWEDDLHSLFPQLIQKHCTLHRTLVPPLSSPGTDPPTEPDSSLHLQHLSSAGRDTTWLWNKKLCLLCAINGGSEQSASCWHCSQPKESSSLETEIKELLQQSKAGNLTSISHCVISRFCTFHWRASSNALIASHCLPRVANRGCLLASRARPIWDFGASVDTNIRE